MNPENQFSQGKAKAHNSRSLLNFFEVVERKSSGRKPVGLQPAMDPKADSTLDEDLPMVFRKSKQVQDETKIIGKSEKEQEFFDRLLVPTSTDPIPEELDDTGEEAIDSRKTLPSKGRLQRLAGVGEREPEGMAKLSTPQPPAKRQPASQEGPNRRGSRVPSVTPPNTSVAKTAGRGATSAKPKPERLSVPKTNEKTAPKTGEIFFDEEATQQFEDSTPSWALREDLLDKKMRPFNHPDYDPTTLYIPKGELEKQTPAMYQYWLQKSENFDKIIFFKLGKFYELFYEDATIGVKELDLNYMGRKQHAGFPESALDRYLTKLVGLGYKVAIVEQTETERQLKARVKQRGVPKNDKIIRREMVSAYSRGTLVDLKSDNHLATLWSLVQQGLVLSVMVLNYETNQIQFTQVDIGSEAGIADLKLLLINFKPDEILAKLSHVDERVREILANLAHRPQFSSPKPTEGAAKRTSLLGRIREKNEALVSFVERERGLSRVNFALFEENFYQLMGYMDSMLLLERLILSCDLEFLANVCAVDDLFMDSQALAHLELLQAQGGAEAGSLLHVIDRCKTPLGKRLLRKTLQRPSANAELISKRLDAVQALGECRKERVRFGKTMEALKDLEKQATQLYKYSLAAEKRVILFEDATSKKLRELGDFLNQVEWAVRAVSDLRETPKLLKSSPLLADLVFLPDLPAIEQLLVELRAQMVSRDATVTPQPGANRDFDTCEEGMRDVYRRAEEYAQQMRTKLNCPEVAIVSSKFRFELEVPEQLIKKIGIPRDFSFASKRTNFERFVTPLLEQLIDELEELEEKRKDILIEFGCQIFKTFLEHRQTWDSLAAVLAHLDVLCGLAEFCFETSHSLCRPIVHPIGSSRGPFLKAQNLKHPVLAALDSSFVGNAVELRPDQPIVVLSGPNMGGKSTIMRTVALNCVLAQIGCFVFGESFEASAVDKIFTRIGASDRLEEKKSTFFIEMEEMKAVLTAATPNSLAIVDELGRGTSTFDGYSIACACLAYLARHIRCRTIFSTHYFFLESDLGVKEGLRFQRMAYEIRKVGDVEKLRFKYLLEDGTCAKSFALNVALIAGIDLEIIQRAEEISGWHRETHDW